MHKHWPLLLLLLIPVAMFPGAIPGERIVSASDHLSVHHAFQTEPGGRVRNPHLSDPALQFRALEAAVSRSIRAGEVPLWNPMIWTGAPLLGDAQSMVGSPATWLRIGLSEALGADAAVVWLLLWVGLGSALFAASLGATPWGAAIAGAAAMTSPYVSVWLLHPHAATAVWLPWILLGLHRRSPLITSVATAGLLMGGHPETAAHAGMVVMAALIVRFRWWVGITWLSVGAALSAPVWMPFVEEVLRSSTLHAHGGNTLATGQLLDLIWPSYHGHPALETWTARQWSWADGRIHPGLGTLLLAVMALAAARERWLWGLWLGGLLVAIFGMPGPLNHARLGGFVALLLAISAGLAPVRRMAWVGLLAVTASGIWAGWHDQGSLSPAVHNPAPAPWTSRLAEHVSTDRVVGLGWALQPNTGALVGIRDVRGYDLPVSVDTERMQTLLNPRPVRPWFRIDTPPATSLLRFLAVRAILSPEPLANGLNLGPAPLFAQSVEGGLGRAWLAVAPTEAADPSGAARMLLSSNDPIAHPPVEGLTGPWPQTGSPIPVDALRETPNTIEMSVTAPAPAIAVISDAWHPGWSVTVDDQPATALRVGGIVRGVQVEAGSHTIRWTFKPTTWNAAWIVWLVGLATLAGYCMRRWSRSVGSTTAPKSMPPV